MIGCLKTSNVPEELLHVMRQAELPRLAHDDQTRAEPASIYRLQERRAVARAVEHRSRHEQWCLGSGIWRKIGLVAQE